MDSNFFECFIFNALFMVISHGFYVGNIIFLLSCEKRVVSVTSVVFLTSHIVYIVSLDTETSIKNNEM